MIREASQDDAERIAGLVRRSIRESDADDYYDEGQVNAWASSNTVEAWEDHIMSKRVVKAVEDGQIVGVGCVDDNVVFATYVCPDSQGEEVGERLLQEILSQVDSETAVVYASLNAVSFYESHGFSKRNKEKIEINEAVLPVYLCERTFS